MDQIDFITTYSTVRDATPEHYYKNGKKPQEYMAKDGTLLVVNSTIGKPIAPRQLKKIETQHLQNMKKVDAKERLLAVLEKRKAEKAMAAKA